MALAILLVLFSSFALAQSADTSITFRGLDPKVLEFDVKNESTEEQPLFVKFIGPAGLDSKVLTNIETLESEEQITLKVRLTPSSLLLNNSYISTLEVTIGSEVVRKQIRLNFLPEPVTQITDLNDNLVQEDENAGSTGFVSLQGTSVETTFNIILFVVGIILVGTLILGIRKIKNTGVEK